MRHLRLIAAFLAVLVMSIPVTFAGTLSLTYDANGNLVTGDGLYREYNAFNQLSRVRNGSNSTEHILQEFVYHPTEERIYIKKTYNSSGSLVETITYYTQTFVEVENTSGRYEYTYVRHEGQLIGQLNPDGSKYYVHGDHLGSSSVVTNQAGVVIENTTYSPFGEVVGGGNLSRFDYEGKEFDSLVGDYDFNFRKYKPQWALFTQPDTLIQNVYDPQSLNRYSFERNNPYRYTDEDGHSWAYVVIGIIGAAWNTYIYHTSHETHTLKGYIGYAASGAIASTSGFTNPYGAATGGVVATGIERFVDEKSLTDQDALVDYGVSAIISGTTYGIGKFLPSARHHLIKYVSSFLTTKTGQTVIKNQIIEQAVGTVLKQEADRAKQSSSTSSGGGSSSGGCGVTMSCAPKSNPPPQQSSPPPPAKNPGCGVYMSCA